MGVRLAHAYAPEPPAMIDHVALAIGHALLAVAMLRLVLRAHHIHQSGPFGHLPGSTAVTTGTVVVCCLRAVWHSLLSMICCRVSCRWRRCLHPMIGSSLMHLSFRNRVIYNWLRSIVKTG